MNEKKELRELLKKRREAISSIRREEAKYKVLEEIYPALASYKNILSFASFQSEIDLWPLNHLLCQEQRLLLSKVEGEELLIYQVDDLSSLIRSKIGILEPNPNTSRPCDLQKIECALISGLGFDRAHHRLGYGKGHFDRLLLKLIDCMSIGVGFKEQWVEEGLPTKVHDQKLKKIMLV